MYKKTQTFPFAYFRCRMESKLCVIDNKRKEIASYNKWKRRKKTTVTLIY